MPGTPALYIVADCSQTAHTSKRNKSIKIPTPQAKNAVNVMQSPMFLMRTLLQLGIADQGAEQHAAQSGAHASILAKSVRLLKYNHAA